VVVAARAAHRQAHKGPRGGVDLLVHNVIASSPGCRSASSFAPSDRKPVDDAQRSNACVEIVGRRQQVAGDLLVDELVVGLVLVEGCDDVVAVAPGVLVAMVSSAPVESA
jgi:hypothetical protein